MDEPPTIKSAEPMTKADEVCMHEFYSNCLWEAVKAKIRYRNRVRVVHMRSHDGLHHFGWVDVESGTLYDFNQTQVVKHWIQFCRFKGYIRQRRGKSDEQT